MPTDARCGVCLCLGTESGVGVAAGRIPGAGRLRAAMFGWSASEKRSCFKVMEGSHNVQPHVAADMYVVCSNRDLRRLAARIEQIFLKNL